LSISIRTAGGKYYQVNADDGTEIELIIAEEGSIDKSSSFGEELDHYYARYERENNLDSAIAGKNFALINRIIKNGLIPSDEQVVQLMRLSTTKNIGSSSEVSTPTFLHFLLDTERGIADSKYVLPLLQRAKDLLLDFEYQSLLELSDGINPAYKLFTGKLRPLYRVEIAAHAADIDTHQSSVHASVDISASKLYARFQEKYPSLVTPSSSTEKGVVGVTRSEAFKALVNSKVEELRAQVKASIEMTDEELTLKMGEAKISKDIADFRFELGAAQRLIDNCCDTGGMTGGNLTVYFNTNSSNGLTLKETLAMVYDALSDDEKLIFTGSDTPAEHDKVAHFVKLVTHLYETKREYNYGSKVGGDLNKCPGGAMNHFIYSLQGIYDPKIIDVAYVTENDLKRAVSEQTNRVLLCYLQGVPEGINPKILSLGLAQWKLGAKLSEAFPQDILSHLQQDVLHKKFEEPGQAENLSLVARFSNYYRNEASLEGEIKAAVLESKMASELSVNMGPIKYSDILSVDEFVEAMRANRLPLYSRSDDGYERTMLFLEREERDYSDQVIQNIIDKRAYSLLTQYQINSDGAKTALLERLVAYAESAELLGEEALYTETSNILSYLIVCEDKERFATAKLLIGPDVYQRYLSSTLQNVTNLTKLKILLSYDPELKQNPVYIDVLTARLWVAASTDSTEGVKTLLELGADINTTNRHGTTALMFAAKAGNIDMVKVFVKRGADVNATDQPGRTALIYATLAANIDMIKALVEVGADINATDPSGNKVLMYALISGRVNIIKTLLGLRADVNATDQYGTTALMRAAGKGNIDAVRILVESGANVDAVDQSGNTALMRAAEMGNIDVVRTLLEKGANIEAVESRW